MSIIRLSADVFPPYQYTDENGEVRGSDYQLVRDTLAKAGYEVSIDLGDWEQVSSAFESRASDVLFQVQDTPERLAKYYLSDKLRDAVTEVVTKNDKLSGLKSYDELSAYRLGVIGGFANGEEIDSLPENCKSSYSGTGELLQALDRGEIDAAVCDQGVRRYLTEDSQEYIAIEALTYKRPLYVMFHSQSLRDEFNSAMEA